jgi:Uma2 family endonuclease
MVMQVVDLLETYTIEEYFAFEETALEKHEFINGKIIPMPGGTVSHNIIALNIGAALKYALKKHSKKYFVMGSDMKISIPQKKQVRYPDAVVICEKIETLDGRKDTIVNPLAIIEVLSNSTREFDKRGKFELYQRIPSLKEYILIEQDSPEVSTFFREEKDLWRTQETTDISVKVKLRSLDIEIDMEDIYDGINF